MPPIYHSNTMLFSTPLPSFPETRIAITHQSCPIVARAAEFGPECVGPVLIAHEIFTGKRAAKKIDATEALQKVVHTSTGTWK